MFKFVRILESREYLACINEYEFRVFVISSKVVIFELGMFD